MPIDTFLTFVKRILAVDIARVAPLAIRLGVHLVEGVRPARTGDAESLLISYKQY